MLTFSQLINIFLKMFNPFLKQNNEERDSGKGHGSQRLMKPDVQDGQAGGGSLR